MTSTLFSRGVQIAGLYLVLCLAATAHASVVNQSTDGNNSIKVKEQTNTTGTPVSPTFFGLFPVIPTYGATGSAYAYEGYDSFDRTPEDKVDVIYGLAGIVVSPKSSTDSASVSQSYGNNFSLTDSAYAEAKFQSTPMGNGITAGPVSSTLVSGISAQMSTRVETQQSGQIPALATATVVDPFHFSGLTGSESLAFSSVLDAGMTFTIDAGGSATDAELRRSFSGSIEIGGVAEMLYELIIAVGVTAAGLPDMVVDFTSSALLGLNDATVTQTILDGFSFDAASSTFLLTTDVTIYDGAIPLSSGVTDFTLAFDSSATADFESQYAHVFGPGNAGGNGSVPVPHALLLMLPGILMLRRRTNRTD